jgi:hypothetical protein
MTLGELQAALRAFVAERDWEQGGQIYRVRGREMRSRQRNA